MVSVDVEEDGPLQSWIKTELVLNQEDAFIKLRIELNHHQSLNGTVVRESILLQSDAVWVLSHLNQVLL